MKLGIMQPYFFPYAQQIRHIQQCDLWITFDTDKFSRKSWVTRNRISNRHKEWSYISIPVVKGATNGSIGEAQLSEADWRKELLDNLRIYETAAPFYQETIDIVEKSVSTPSPSVGHLNTFILKTICGHLGIETPIQQLSDMSLNLPDTADPGEWALLISKEVGADVYSNAPGGVDLFDPNHYKKHGVTLEFYEPIVLEYQTPGFTFVHGLSVLDAMMWMGTKNFKKWCHL